MAEIGPMFWLLPIVLVWVAVRTLNSIRIDVDVRRTTDELTHDTTRSNRV